MKKFFWIALLLIMIAFSAQAQNNYGEIVNTFNKAFPYEKIFLHTDKPYYFQSDTIWFKAYVSTPEEDFRQSPTPSVPLYVELIKPSVNPYASRMIIKLKEGKGQGDIVLPRDLNPGIYQLRAYTSHSLNFGRQAIFEKDIIISEFGKKGMRQVNENDFSISLHPEGGIAVAGYNQKFAIRSLDNNGNGIPIKGYISTAMGDTVTSFSTDQTGLGSLEFTPLPDIKYQVHTANQQGTSKSFQIPGFASNGYSLKIDPLAKKDSLQIEVLRVGMEYDTSAKLHIIQNGYAQEEFDLEFKENSAFLELSNQKFHPGLSVFKLVLNGNEPVAERLVYINGKKEVDVKISPSKITNLPKEKVDLEITIVDAFGNPVQGEFSISITDAKQVVPSKDPVNIETFLNLKSELSGETPAQYSTFLQDPKKLDNFLMTQSWRSFLPELEILNKEKPAYVFETGLNIAGEVADNPWKGARDLRLLVIDKDGYPEIHEGHTDDDGRFVFLGMDFTDSVGVYLQSFELKSRKNRNPKEIKSGQIEINQLEIPTIPHREKLEEIVWVDLLENDPYLQEVKMVNDMIRKSFLMNEFELDEFVVKGRRVYRQDPRTIAYNDDPDIRLRIPEETYNYLNIFELLTARATRRGVSFSPDNNYFIDGSFANYQMVNNLRVSDIEFVDILLGRRPNQMNIAGRTSYNILTKNGNPNFDWSSVKVAGTSGFKLQGYAPTREFYIPSDKQDVNSPISMDYRSTLYWNPNVLTDKKGQASISFPLSEGATLVHVNVQGISEKGLPFHGTFEFKVQSQHSELSLNPKLEN